MVLKRKEVIPQEDGRVIHKYVFKKPRYEIKIGSLWKKLKQKYPDLKGIVLAEDDIPLERAEIDIIFERELSQDEIDDIKTTIEQHVDEDWEPLWHPYMNDEDRIVHLSKILEHVKVDAVKQRIQQKINEIKTRILERRGRLKQLGL